MFSNGIELSTKTIYIIHRMPGPNVGDMPEILTRIVFFINSSLLMAQVKRYDKAPFQIGQNDLKIGTKDYRHPRNRRNSTPACACTYLSTLVPDTDEGKRSAPVAFVRPVKPVPLPS